MDASRRKGNIEIDDRGNGISSKENTNFHLYPSRGFSASVKSYAPRHTHTHTHRNRNRPSRDINVNGSSRRKPCVCVGRVTREEERRGEEGDERDAEKKTRNEGSSFSLLFPLIKISNMITADLATIIERLRLEFAKPRASSRHPPFPPSSSPLLSSPSPYHLLPSSIHRLPGRG